MYIFVSENQDFRGFHQLFVLSPTVQNVTARFSIVDDLLPEEREFFTAIIDTDDEFVKVTVPTTRIFITDNDGEFTFSD